VKSIRKRLSYANVMSSIAVFLVLGGASAYAAKKIGSHELKANSVTTAKIKKNAITTKKIKNNAVTGAKVKESTLGEVPLATNAGTATKLVGQTSYVIKLSGGATQLIATNGAVSMTAKCETGVEGTKDRVRILASTTVDGAVMQGDTPHLGDVEGFLNVATPEEKRVLTSATIATGTVHAEFDIDRGYVLGPEGKGLGFNTEGGPLALNYAGAKCFVAGVVNALG